MRQGAWKGRARVCFSEDRVLLELVVDNSGHVQQSLRWDLRKYVKRATAREEDRHVVA